LAIAASKEPLQEQAERFNRLRQMNLFALSIFLPEPTNPSPAPVFPATTSHYKALNTE
jgi:hypothetical protein